MSAKDLAYSGNKMDNFDTFRLERGHPYTRAGLILAPIPQFKGLYLYTPAAGQVQKQFKQTMTETRVKWPVNNVPNVPAGS